MPQQIQLKSTTGTGNPPTLLRGEPAVAVGATVTRMWIGDGTNNILLISSNPADNPVGTDSYLPLAGGVLLGIVKVLPPVDPTDAANKQYVDTTIANLRLFQGTWEVANNDPDLTTVTPTPGDYYICVTDDPSVPETAPANIPGIGGLLISNGDYIFWNATLTEWNRVAGGALTVAEADGLYLSLSGGTLTGPLLLAANPQVAAEASNKAYVDGLIAMMVPLTGAVMQGPITMAAAYAPVNGQDVATKAYTDSLQSGGVFADGVSILGTGTSGDPFTVGLVDGGVF